MFASTARKGVDRPTDPYSPDWLEFYRLHPDHLRSVGAAAVDEGAVEEGGDPKPPAKQEADPAPADTGEAEEGNEPEPALEGESEGEADDEQEQGQESDEDEEAPEVDVFDFGGNKLELPKGSVPEELRAKIDEFTKGTWGDYTRKSQEAAEKAKALEARERAVEKIVSLNGEALQTYSQGLHLKAEIEQLSQVDLQALWQSDPDRARRVSDDLARKQAQFQQVVQKVSQQEAEVSKAQAEELSRRKEEGKAAVERQIKGFSEKLPEVVDFVSGTFGMDRETVEKDWPLNPAFAVMAYESMLYRRMQAQTKKPAPKPAAKPVKPMPGKGGKAPPLDLVRDADKMSPEEWARRRNKQVADRKRA